MIGSTHDTAPTTADAARVLREVMGTDVADIERFPTGLAHYVYDARLADSRRYVVRLARAGQVEAFSGTLYWNRPLVEAGVPLPGIHYHDITGTAFGFPVLIMERLPGTDLGDIYLGLSRGQKQQLAQEIVALQYRAATLPRATGFGFARSYDDPLLRHSWRDVLDANLERSKRWIRAAGLVDPEVVEPVRMALRVNTDYFAGVEPVCFLDDTTTKNVIVSDGRLSGVVDVDVICFGDPLFTPALTRMALLSLGYDTVYVDAWVDALGLSGPRRSVLTLYTAIFCLAFLGELGQAFNREHPEPEPQRRLQRLLDILADLLAAVGSLTQD